MNRTYKGCSRIYAKKVQQKLKLKKLKILCLHHHLFNISSPPSFNSGTTFTAFKSKNMNIFYLIDLTLTISVYTSIKAKTLVERGTAAVVLPWAINSN